MTMVQSIFAQGPGTTGTPGYYLPEQPARRREKRPRCASDWCRTSCASPSFATELSSKAMLASITITPGNGLVASKYMPVTNPASPPSKTLASRTPSNLVSTQALRVRAHGIAGGGRPERWHQGISGFELQPRVPTSRAAQLAAARNYRVSASCARVSSLFALSAVEGDHDAFKPLPCAHEFTVSSQQHCSQT